MKHYLTQMHHIIDYISVSLFLYCILVLVGIEATPYIANEKVRAIIVVTLPFLFLKRKIIKKANNLFHRFFGFFR